VTVVPGVFRHDEQWFARDNGSGLAADEGADRSTDGSDGEKLGDRGDGGSGVDLDVGLGEEAESADFGRILDGGTAFEGSGKYCKGVVDGCDVEGVGKWSWQVE